MNTETRIIPILSARIARDLIQQQKFNLIDITPNKIDKSRTVFVFENTDQLKDYLQNKHDMGI